MNRARHPHRYHVCNGDADGLTSVLQWRLHDRSPARLVTGLKRDIALLKQVPVEHADEVLVCDLSIARNREPLQRLLDAGVRVRYFDHHVPGPVPVHDKLELHVDTDPQLCTSLLMDRYLAGRFHAWALVGAYGDALTAVAHRHAAAAGFGGAEREALRRLGEAINYNAYGESAEDVRIAPAALFERMVRHEDPLEMVAHEDIVDELDRQREDDLQHALDVEPAVDQPAARAVVLPDAPWSRRVIGCLANVLAAAAPRQAQAVLRQRADDTLLVSVRAPRATPGGADAFCAGFGGGGRAGAAGIEALPQADLPRFLAAFAAAPWGHAASTPPTPEGGAAAC